MKCGYSKQKHNTDNIVVVFAADNKIVIAKEGLIVLLKQVFVKHMDSAAVMQQAWRALYYIAFNGE